MTWYTGIRWIASILIIGIYIKPIVLASTSDQVNNTSAASELNNLVDKLHYSKYLKEIMELLKTDSALSSREAFEQLSAGGTLADHFGKAGDKVRTKLDELKRLELQRIKLISEELKKRGQKDIVIRHNMRIVTKHVDLKDLSKFSTEDLRKIILQANAELNLLDTERRSRFKEYDMHKHLEFEELFKRLSPEQKKELEEKKRELLSKHAGKMPTVMPVSKKHFIKVWEERDRMNRENFNVKTFFHLHDLDGNGFLDEYETKVLLENEVLDAYDPAAPDFDPKVREEDLERMMTYAFETIDLNKDHLINLEEFIANTKRAGYDDHTFWEHLKNIPVYTDEEYAAYSSIHRAEVNTMIDEHEIKLDLSGIVIRAPKEAGEKPKKSNLV